MSTSRSMVRNRAPQAGLPMTSESYRSSAYQRPSDRSWEEQQLEQSTSQNHHAMGIANSRTFGPNAIACASQSSTVFNQTQASDIGELLNGWCAAGPLCATTQHVETTWSPNVPGSRPPALSPYDPGQHIHEAQNAWPSYREDILHTGASPQPYAHEQASPVAQTFPSHGDTSSGPAAIASYHQCPHLFGYPILDSTTRSESGSGSTSQTGSVASHDQGGYQNNLQWQSREIIIDGAGLPDSNNASTSPSQRSPTPPTAADLQPQEQTPRHAGDLYTPRWVRGNGTAREGWCDICRSWKVLKNSAYWYDKTFVHSISTITGRPFDGPIRIKPAHADGDAGADATQASASRVRVRSRSSNNRVNGDQEGQCGHCGSWIRLNSNHRQTANGEWEHTWGLLWLRHAHKCHSRRHGAHSSSNTIAE